ncbi:MAG: hypothetical protein AABZ62_02055, partial [Planctomycetota bacterium]
KIIINANKLLIKIIIKALGKENICQKCFNGPKMRNNIDSEGSPYRTLRLRPRVNPNRMNTVMVLKK